MSIIETDIPARLDRMRWSRFHWLVIAALGSSWVLDGLEVTLVGSLSTALTDPGSLGLTASEIGLAASAYLAGAISGAIGFGYWADRWGRKRLFIITVAVYAVAAAASGLAWNFASFAVFRLMTGAGIGGEYSAINSAIQELIPARCRGWTDLAVNGSFWAGALLGAGVSSLALDPAVVSPALGWRFAFLAGGVLAAAVIGLRRYIPESPRWLMTHGRLADAEDVVTKIEQSASSSNRASPELPRAKRIRLRAYAGHNLLDVGRMLATRYPRRTFVGLTLMAAQAFLYNAIFFTYALVLDRFYGVAGSDVGKYITGFALANLAGPFVLGHLFDSLGRKTMIAATYCLSGALMGLTALLFDHGAFTATTQTAAWIAIFFVASPAASAAYLTVGESFPLEFRALAIALFYALGTAIGGIAAPAFIGSLIETGSRHDLMWAYLAGAGLMIAAGIVAALLGLRAERRSLEDIAAPLALAEIIAPDRPTTMK